MNDGIPKEVFDFDMGCNKIVCPGCDSRLIGVTPYCPQCGGKLNWLAYWNNKKKVRDDAILVDY